MNKIYRIVWSETLCAFVVANENSKAKGKPSTVRKAVASAVILALAALASESVYAICGVSGNTTINGAETSACYLATNESLTVSGSIVANSGIGAVYLSGITAGSITNSGEITGSTGINILNSALSAGITNSGNITGLGSVGILIVAGTVNGGITNTGTISGAFHGIKVDTVSKITGGINNSGVISGSIDGIYIVNNSSITGGITNGGTITSSGSVGIQIFAGKVNGGITNTGMISGASDGFKLYNNSTITGGITNSSTISGAQHAILVASGSTLDGITITGANTAAFIGDVVATNTPVTILGGSTFTGTNAFDVQSFNIASGAVFNMTAMPSSLSNSSGITTTQGVNNAGTLSIAEGVTGHITGNYTQSSTGVFQLGASSTSNYGKLAVTGIATLPNNANIDVNVNNINLFGTGGGTLSGVISSATLTSNGSFNVTDNSVLVDFIGMKNGNQVDLSVVVQGGVLTSVAALGNSPASGAASALDNLLALKTNNGTTGNAGMDLVINKLISNSTSHQQVSNVVSQTLPLHTGGETSAITESLHSLNHIVQSRLEGQQGLSSGDSYYEDGRAWVKPFGSFAKQGDYQEVSGFSAITSGIVLGADTNVERSNRVGAALSLANTDVSGNSEVAHQSSNVATYQFTTYGSQRLDDETEVNFQAGVGKHINKGIRAIAFMGSTAQSSYHSLSEELGVGIAHTMSISEVTSFTPSLRFDYTTVHNDAYTESGAGALDLKVNRSIVNEMRTSADGKLTHMVDEHIVLTGNLGVGYDSLAKQTSIVSAFAGDSTASFTTKGFSPSPWIARGGLGFVRTDKSTEVALRYDADASTSHFVGQTVSARFRWSF